jgi:hypothetical protein
MFLELSAERNRATWSHEVLLSPRFRLGNNVEHSDERAARCDPPVLAASGGKMSLQLDSAAFIFVHYMLSRRRKRREGRWWQTELYRKRPVYSGTGLLADLKCQWFSGRYKKCVVYNRFVWSRISSVRFGGDCEWGLTQACSTFHVVQVASAKFGPRANNMNFNTQNGE